MAEAGRAGLESEYGPQVARLAKYGHVVFVADYLLARPGQPGLARRS